MALRMTDVELEAFRESLANITARGSEAEVRAHIDAFFPRLPEAMQNEILAGLFLDSLRAETKEIEGK
jgi:hypothetical protein